MIMNVLIERLKANEGLSLTPYKDTNGYWTIGRGHRLRKFFKPNLVWTLEQADEQFMLDVYTASDAFLPYKRANYPRLDVMRSGVCVELIFWMGFSGFKGFRQMNIALKNEDYKLAALELYNSQIGRDPKLRRRARRLSEILWEGVG